MSSERRPGPPADRPSTDAADQVENADGVEAKDWSDPTWLADVHRWIRDRLADRDLEVNGPIEQPHLTWWATAMRIPTERGVVWFKASRPSFAVEIPVLSVLSVVRPELTAQVLAADRARGWLLTRDSGMMLRTHAPGREQLALWEGLLPRYADLQRATVQHVPWLLAEGINDHRTTGLTDQARALAEDERMLTTAPEDALTTEELAHFRDVGLAAVERSCQELLALGIPDTVQHDDLHDGNVLVAAGQTRGGGNSLEAVDRLVIFDWGDACVSHPFHTLVVTLRALAYKQKLTPGSTDLTRLRDAYLEPWTAYASRADLIAAADIARRTGTIQRALAWWLVILEMPQSRRHELQDSVPYGVRQFLRDGPWGTYT